MKIALFASGNGSNVQAIIDAVKQEQLQADIVALFCDKPSAYVIERAQRANITTLVLSPTECENRMSWEERIVHFLKQQGAELIVLAGFMRIVGETLLTAYPNRILNIHPSLLPLFPGKNGIGDAYAAGVKETGVTVHFVDSGIDTGPIIAQEVVQVGSKWTLSDLETAIHEVEHQLYPRTIQQVINQIKGGQ